MGDIVDEVKDKNAIEDVVTEFFELGRKVGTKMRARQHDSLVVDVAKQRYYWNSQGEDGDVIAFVQKRKGLDFKGAVEWLADRVGVQVKWGGRDAAQSLANRQREDVFSVACQVWANYLWQNPAALAYARGRGFDDETIRLAGLGYTGGKGLAQDMRGELKMRDIDPECPAAVCVLGIQGDVRGWAAKYGVDLGDHSDWVDQRYIAGAMGRERLVYPHVYGGRTRYFTTRAILDGVQWEDQADGARKEVRKSWNPSKTLAGPRQPFYNQVYDRLSTAVVIVEGPADAVTLGVWGYSAVALCGVTLKDAEGMGVLAERLKKHAVKYVALDADVAGGKNLREVATAFGPLARLVRWPSEAGEGGGGVSGAETGGGESTGGAAAPVGGKSVDDELLGEALALAEASGKGVDGVSIALLCRKLEIGRTRAGRLYEAVKEVFEARAAATGGTVVPVQDELLEAALALADEQDGKGEEVTISFLQRRLRIGYVRAARLYEAVGERSGLGVKAEPVEDGEVAAHAAAEDGNEVSNEH